MKLADIDWGVLRGSLIWLGVSVAVSISLVWANLYFRENVQSLYDRHQRSLFDMRNRYQAAGEEKNLIDTYLPRYQALKEQGIVGMEHRLNWVETLRGAAARLKLPYLHYDISSQSLFTPHPTLRMGAFKVYASDMRLQLGLLHEGDLLNLLLDLDRGAMGLYSVVGCTLSRIHPHFNRDPAEPNLNATCELRWYTIKSPDGSGLRK